MSSNNRLCKVLSHLTPVQQLNPNNCNNKNSLTVIDNRTGKSYNIPMIADNVVHAKAFAKIVHPSKTIGIRLYDPGYMNTIAASSSITYIDGPAGILTYRGYPIEELATKSTFLEVAYLLIFGELPTKSQFAFFESRVMKHTFFHEDMALMMKSFRYDAHPMGMLITALAALGTVHPEANPALSGSDIYSDLKCRNKQIYRIIGSVPTIAAFAYRHRQGRPFSYPSHNKLSYVENFLFMIDKYSNLNYRPHPTLSKALDILFILHADHELNCSTSAMRHLTSSGVDVYTSLAGAAGALYGPRHGGANEAVLRMLAGIGSKENVAAFVEKVKRREVLLMGFGHRVYKNYDPRAKIVRKVAETVFDILGREPLIEVAEELERVALSDPYFIKRKLYPNVDFYSGLIYKALGFPTDFFPVLFAIPRTVGWLAHWNEFLDDKENRIVRPRQLYKGKKARSYVPMEKRTDENTGDADIQCAVSAEAKRRFASDISP